jgi:hypothetical protein
VESYDVTLKFIGRDGKPTGRYNADLSGAADLAADKQLTPYDADGEVTLRVPKGGYVLDTAPFVSKDPKGTKVGSNDDPLFDQGEFKVPAGDAQYHLTTSVKRSAKVASAASRLDASWTFRSRKTTAVTQLPASVVRFHARTGLDGTAPAGKKVSVPVTVQGAAEGSNLESLTTYVSYDRGRPWKKVTGKKGAIGIRNPSRGKSISLRASVVYDVYYGKWAVDGEVT